MSALFSTSAVTGTALDPFFARWAPLISAAQSGIDEPTPLVRAFQLSRVLGHDVDFKLENLYPEIFSFKGRGAYNYIANTPKEVLANGVVTASAGNHAQGLARAGREYGVKVTIVMPVNTPQAKVDAVRAILADVPTDYPLERRGEVLLYGNNFDEALAKAHELEEKKNLNFAHPYDDPLVIAGQGTVAREFIAQYAQRNESLPDVIFVPIGGGGLMAGTIAYIKLYHPEIKIVGVELEGQDSMNQAHLAGEIVTLTLSHDARFADGTAVGRAGNKTFPFSAYLDDLIVVNKDELMHGTKVAEANSHTHVETAGGLGTAGLIKWAARQTLSRGDAPHVKQKLLAIISGGNIDDDRKHFIRTETALQEGRTRSLLVRLDEEPDSLEGLCDLFGENYNIAKLSYKFGDPLKANVFIEVAVADECRHAPEIVSVLDNNGYEAYDVTDNEYARAHAASEAVKDASRWQEAARQDELLYTLTFPERPGALKAFLKAKPRGVNITDFHHERDGSGTGKVSMRFVVPPEQRDAFMKFIEEHNGVPESKNEIFAIMAGNGTKAKVKQPEPA